MNAFNERYESRAIPMFGHNYKTVPGSCVIRRAQEESIEDFVTWQQRTYETLEYDKKQFVAPRSLSDLKKAIDDDGVLYIAADQVNQQIIATAVGYIAEQPNQLAKLLNVDILAGECSYASGHHVVIGSVLVGMDYRRQGVVQAMFEAASHDSDWANDVNTVLCVATNNMPAIMAAFKAGYVMTALGFHRVIQREVYVFSRTAVSYPFISDRVVQISSSFGWLELQNLLDAGFCATMFNPMMGQMQLAVHLEAQRQLQAA